MKKVLAKSYLCLIYVFFALFVLILRMDANEHTNIYSLGLILAAIFLSIIPFFTNHCKKIEARRGNKKEYKEYSIHVIWKEYDKAIYTKYRNREIINVNRTVKRLNKYFDYCNEIIKKSNELR